MKKRRAFISAGLFLAGAAIILASACGGGGTTTEIKVSLKEWSVTPDVAVAKGGNVRFVVTNDGKEPHEFVILKTDLAPDALPVVDGKVDEERVNHIDEIESFAANKIETKKVDLKPGKYVFICNIVERVPGQPVGSHYEQGMRIGFTVSQ